jgi:hypothetical protein
MKLSFTAFFAVLLMTTVASAQTYEITNYPMSLISDIIVSEDGRAYCGHIWGEAGITVVETNGDTTKWVVANQGLFYGSMARLAFDQNGDILTLSYGAGYMHRFDINGQYDSIGQVANSFPADYSTSLIFESDTSVLTCSRYGIHRMNTNTGVSTFLYADFDMLGAVIDPVENGIWATRSSSQTGEAHTLLQLDIEGNYLGAYDDESNEGLGVYVNVSKTYPLALGPNGSVWYGASGNGIWHRDADGTVSNIDTSAGLPSNIIHDIAFDAGFEHLWLATAYGLSRYHLATQVFTNYGPAQGLGDTTIYAVTIAPNGDIYAGGLYGGLDKLSIVSAADDLKDLAFSISPNPAQGACILTLAKPLPYDAVLRFINMAGQEMDVWPVFADTKQFEIDVTDWSVGVYQIQIEHENQVVGSVKLQKQ